MLSAGLDYYKPTMSQVQYEKYPDAQVVFRLKNRGDNVLTDYINAQELQSRLDQFRGGWNNSETAYLATHERRDGDPLFTQEYLAYLEENELPPARVSVNEDTGDIDVVTDEDGKWPLSTFWETVVMSEANEMYFNNYIAQNGLDVMDVYDEGDRRLSAKIDILRSRPDIQFADFGTRRRFSLRWHDYVVDRLARECPDNLIGSSNVALAEKYDIMPIGTFAHEMPMVYAALAEDEGYSSLEGHRQMLYDWEDKYGENLSTALTDTFGSEYFFADFTPEQARTWKALRHDSGDPYAFGEKVIEFYKDLGIDPQEKTIVFSDGLDMDAIVGLADYFGGKINIVFGWGTTLTNDMGLPTNKIVMKAIRADGYGTVKTSDEPGKYTGEKQDVDGVLSEVRRFMIGVALREAQLCA